MCDINLEAILKMVKWRVWNSVSNFLTTIEKKRKMLEKVDDVIHIRPICYILHVQLMTLK